MVISYLLGTFILHSAGIGAPLSYDYVASSFHSISTPYIKNPTKTLYDTVSHLHFFEFHLE